MSKPEIRLQRVKSPTSQPENFGSHDTFWLETDEYIVFLNENGVPFEWQSIKYGFLFDHATGVMEFDDRRTLVSGPWSNIPDEVCQILEVYGYEKGIDMEDVRDRLYEGVSK